MITTKQTELQIIDSFNDLMKDTKEKQRVNKLIKQYSFDFFMEKLSDSQLEDNISSLDVFENLSSHYQKYAYVIVKRIVPQIVDKYCRDEDYYDGECDVNGAQIAKKRRVLDTRKASKDFEGNITEEITNLVVEDYFKNLNRALEVYNFNNKIDNLRDKEQKKRFKDLRTELEQVTNNHLRGLFNHYKQKGCSNYEIVESFKYDRNIINYLLDKIINTMQQDYDVKLDRDNVEKVFAKERNMFIKTINTKEIETEEESYIPLGWKFFAVTEFINRLFK